MIRKVLLLAAGWFLLMPAVALAHGGVEHNTDDAVIQLYQTPLSPVAHEFVKTDFIFTDKAGQRLKNLPVTLTLTDTHEGDESKDQVVLERHTRTDVNGILSFGYRYSKPDYYDIDLDFTVNGRPQEGGFLLSIRNPYKNWYSLGYLAVLAAGVGLGWWLGQRRGGDRSKPGKPGPKLAKKK